MTEDLYRIGAVAKRTGITPECLRAWGRRYGLEAAERAGRTRFYSTAQIDRLTSIKALLDQGHPISQVIRLSADELRRRLTPRRVQSRAGTRVALVGAPLVQAYHDAEGQRIDVVAEWAGLADVGHEAGSSRFDCVLVYIPSLDPQRIEDIEEKCPEARAVVAFKYATAADLAQCRAAGYPLIRWPAEWQALERVVVAACGLRDIGDHVRRFSDEELLHVSLMASRAACECPRHLAALIGELNDYATHAHRCQGDGRHDAIERDVQAARASLERALAGQIEEHSLLVTAN